MSFEGPPTPSIRGTERYLKRRMMNKRLNPVERKQVKRLIAGRQELKYYAYPLALTAITSTASVVDVSAIPQGDSDSDRDGDALMWCGNIEMRIHAQNGVNSATADYFNNIRFIVFQWHPNSVPTAASILLTGASGSIDYLSQYSHDNRQEYKILYDKTFVTVGNNQSISGTNSYAPNVQHTIRKRISLKKATKKCQFVAGTTVATNRFYTLAISDSSVVTHPSLSYTLKFFFRDS